ncbi:hypothetical protein EAG18_16990 [Pseudoalteromonas sp. J010]|uniref:polysaccharide deacetylase family protein n=1 Tax=Pseudoalteromonas sp. J010 TaxID=998465 RepID=UPI000F645E24|nr:polysaccharide deacetylase family protein [Pseudoalteromonas sp. J010]RRS07443.1 hypothetical protein EAG18_16990 [Pseudoalteromonas sp. J010]
MKIRISTLVLALLLSGCGGGSDKAENSNGNSNVDNNGAEKLKLTSTKKILNAQGSPESKETSQQDFESAGFTCVNSTNLDAIKDYLSSTKEKLSKEQLDERLCSVADLYGLKSKNELTAELMQKAGITGLLKDDGEVNHWAVDEVKLAIIDEEFKYTKLQKLVDQFHYNQEYVWPKQINLSFDDGGALPTLYNHLWLFSKYDAKFTFYASFYDDLDKAKIVELVKSGHEIGHHGTKHLNAELYSAEHGIDKWFQEDVYSQLVKMKADGFNITSFAYPYGAHSLATDNLLNNHFSHIRKFAAWENLHYKGERSDGVFTYGLSIDSHMFDFEKVKNAIDNLKGGETLYLASHAIGVQGDVWFITAENLEKVLAYAKSKNLQFCKTSECLNFKNTEKSVTTDELIETIIASQGSEKALSLPKSTFASAGFSCVNETNLNAVQEYLKTSKSAFTAPDLKIKICNVTELFEVTDKSRLTIEQLVQVGITGLNTEDKAINRWAFDEVIANLPDAPVSFSKVQQLVDEFHYNQKYVWPKQINISFDDGGALPTLYNHLWLFDKYDATFTFYASFYHDLNKNQMHKLVARGHEIGHHGTRHVNAELYSAKYGVEQWLEDDVLSQLRLMEQDGFDVKSFAYPYGAHSLATDIELKKHFKHIRKFAAWEGLEYKGERSDGIYTYGLSVDSHMYDIDKVKAAIDKLRGGETLYLASHAIGVQGDIWYITAENLESILAYASEKGLKFCHTSECMNFKASSN